MTQTRLNFSRIGRWPAAAALLLALSACASAPVYKPKNPGDTTGYTDEQLTANRYRVTFSGGTNARREDVEDFLLRRAAEVTLEAGFDSFAFDTRTTEPKTYYRETFDTWGPRFGPRFGPRPWYGPGRFAYWSNWPYDGQADITPVTRYTAYAEIVMLRPAQAANNPDAISARDVLDRVVPAMPPGARGPG